MEDLNSRKSCDNCRLSKTKCDKKLPCDRCVQRKLDCEYTDNTCDWKLNKKYGSLTANIRELEKQIDSLQALWHSNPTVRVEITKIVGGLRLQSNASNYSGMAQFLSTYFAPYSLPSTPTHMNRDTQSYRRSLIHTWTTSFIPPSTTTPAPTALQKEFMSFLVLDYERQVINYIVEQYFRCAIHPHLDKEAFVDIFEGRTPASEEHEVLALAIACQWSIHTILHHGWLPGVAPIPESHEYELATQLRQHFFRRADRLLRKNLLNPHPYIIAAIFHLGDYLQSTAQTKKRSMYHGIAIRLFHAKSHDSVSPAQSRRDLALWAFLVDSDRELSEQGFPRAIPLEFLRTGPESSHAYDLTEVPSPSFEDLQTCLAMMSHTARLHALSTALFKTFDGTNPISKPDLHLESLHRQLSTFHSSLPPSLRLATRQSIPSRIFALALAHNYYYVLVTIYKHFLLISSHPLPPSSRPRALRILLHAATAWSHIVLTINTLRPCYTNLRDIVETCAVHVELLACKDELIEIGEAAETQVMAAMLIRSLKVLKDGAYFKKGDVKTTKFVNELEGKMSEADMGQDRVNAPQVTIRVEGVLRCESIL